MKTLFQARAEINAKVLTNKLALDKEHLLHWMYYNYGS